MIEFVFGFAAGAVVAVVVPPVFRAVAAAVVAVKGWARPVAAKVVADAEKVKLGGFAPTLADTHDASKVRLGGFAPTL